MCRNLGSLGIWKRHNLTQSTDITGRIWRQAIGMALPALRGPLKVLSEIPNEKFQCNQLKGAYISNWDSLAAQMVKHLPTMWETRIWSLGWEDPLEKELATHSSILAWKIPWTEEPGRLESMGSQRVGHDWVTSLSLSYKQLHLYE